MNGFRKLKVGEIIKEGDIFHDASVACGTIGLRVVNEYPCYRPLKTPSKKAYPRRIQSGEIIFKIIRGITGCDHIKAGTATFLIDRFLRNNYRRRRKQTH